MLCTQLILAQHSQAKCHIGENLCFHVLDGVRLVYDLTVGVYALLRIPPVKGSNRLMDAETPLCLAVPWPIRRRRGEKPIQLWCKLIVDHAEMAPGMMLTLFEAMDDVL